MISEAFLSLWLCNNCNLMQICFLYQMLVNSNEKNYSALHSRNGWVFKSSLLSKKAMPSDNQFYEMIVIYLKLARILMLFFSWATEDCSRTCSSSAVNQSCLLAKT